MDVYGTSSLSCLPFKYVHSTYFTLNEQSSSLATTLESLESGACLDRFCCQDGIGSWWKEGQLVVLHTPQQRCDDHLGAIHFQKIEAELKPKTHYSTHASSAKKNISFIRGVFAAGRRLHHPASRKCTSKNHWPVS